MKAARLERLKQRESEQKGEETELKDEVKKDKPPSIEEKKHLVKEKVKRQKKLQKVKEDESEDYEEEDEESDEDMIADERPSALASGSKRMPMSCRKNFSQIKTLLRQQKAKIP